MTSARLCRQATASSPNTPAAERTQTSTPRKTAQALRAAGRRLAAGASAVYRAVAVSALTVLVIGAGLIPRRRTRPGRHALRRPRGTTR